MLQWYCGAGKRRERHAFVSANGLGYPGRAIWSRKFLYVRNYEPDRWPAGDPPVFGDVDARILHYSSATKMELLTRHEDEAVRPLFGSCEAAVRRALRSTCAKPVTPARFQALGLEERYSYGEP